MGENSEKFESNDGMVSWLRGYAFGKLFATLHKSFYFLEIYTQARKLTNPEEEFSEGINSFILLETERRKKCEKGEDEKKPV